MTDTSTSTRRSLLLVPLFALLGVGGLSAYSKADDAHIAAEWAHCGDLPLTWQIYLSAYGALACGMLAFALFWWLARRAGRRDTWVGDSWPGKLAIAALVVDVPLVALQFIAVWYLYQPSPGGPISCV
ncbi:hypothetical protein [Streptomyces sp. NPDC048637]|uniref:hypothetical protein n=1 Tax=Streptomyces sp. NPDC048637 TaxID=3155636 RepID=UPI00344AC416